MLFEIFFTYSIDWIPFEKFEGSTLKQKFFTSNKRQNDGGEGELGNWHQFRTKKNWEKNDEIELFKEKKSSFKNQRLAEQTWQLIIIQGDYDLRG